MQHTPVEKLLDGASYLFGVTPDVMLSHNRKPRIFRARAAVALAARCGGYSYRQIGPAMAGRDHKAIMNACDRAEIFYKADPEFRRRCDMLIGVARRSRDAANDNAYTGDCGARIDRAADAG